MNNQMMTVKIGQYGSVNIGHKTKIGKAQDIMAIYGLIAEQKGLESKTLHQILRSQEFWRYVAATSNLMKNKEYSNSDAASELESLSNFNELEKYLDLYGKVNYKELIKQFPDLIQSKKGRYGGTWMHVNLLLKLASILDPDLEALIYDTFVTGKILQLRDDGGESFKALNVAIDNYLPTSGGVGNNKHMYCKAAEKIRKVVGLDKQVLWNNATTEQLAHRDKLLTNTVMFLERGFLQTEQDLLNNLK